MIARAYKYEIETTKKGNRNYKKYHFTFIIEFTYNNSLDWLEKTANYIKQYDKIHFVDKESDGNFYIYLRKRKYKLEKGVNVI